jgi:hypothetical protein
MVREHLEKIGYCCETCGGYLQQGYHQHHANGNHSDISKENLWIDCPFCHRSKMGETLELQDLEKARKAFNDRLRTGLEMIENIVTQGLGRAVDDDGKPLKQLSGSSIGELNSSVDNYFKNAWRLYNPVHYPTPLPVDIVNLHDKRQSMAELRAWEDGWKQGRLGVIPDETPA